MATPWTAIGSYDFDVFCDNDKLRIMKEHMQLDHPISPQMNFFM